ncbi:Phosphocarrier protein HPr [Acholeplasma oculi]|uniref:Phosphocarrier protein HPr n=1 Tax=Acholeplasma oculi TaxID=35623 RepID=A0A061AHR4_9MOLU|nr:HPr family phosphocarrier protein [Acholeplasma oculi]CDR31136.1 Phosphotransferase system PTS, HPr histidine phosphorylation site [Acholeplasma oculi]SKC37373.1 phosphocarrier protein [Acholeplasma oculi]SUT90910.1 Phosphocarrier protein HPr [Acholeplasma oculi]
MKQKFVIVSEYGLHARPATRLVNQAMSYQSEISLSAFNRTVNLKSIMGVMSLGIYNGEIVEVQAEGEDAAEAIEGLTNFMIQEGLGQVKE